MYGIHIRKYVCFTLSSVQRKQWRDLSRNSRGSAGYIAFQSHSSLLRETLDLLTKYFYFTTMENKMVGFDCIAKPQNKMCSYYCSDAWWNEPRLYICYCVLRCTKRGFHWLSSSVSMSYCFGGRLEGLWGDLFLNLQLQFEIHSSLGSLWSTS